MHTITFYSYKGGVGRTLAVTNVARYLARMGKKVFLLDFDLEAPGLHYKLGLEQGQALEVGRGLVDILSEFAVHGRLPEVLTDYVIEVPSPALSSGKIHLLPAGNAPSPAYWKKLSKVDWHRLFYAEQAEGIPLFLELKAFIEETYDPDFVLIDARTGITEMGGVATTVLSDRVACLMLPTREHLDGTRGVMHAIRSAPRMEGVAELELLAVLSRLTTTSDEEEAAEADGVLEFLNAPIDELGTSLGLEDILVLHRDPGLEQREQILVGGVQSIDDSTLLRDYVRLFVRLVPQKEIEKSIGPLIEDIQKRVFVTPDEAEQALEELTRYSMLPEAYRGLLAMYRLRRTDSWKAIQIAYSLWAITGDAHEACLWEAVRGYARRPGREMDLKRIDAVEANWRAQGAYDSRLAIELSRHHTEKGLAQRALGVLEFHATTPNPSSDAVSRLIDLLCESKQRDRATEEVERFKPKMSTEPTFLRAWVEKVLGDYSYNDLHALLADPSFQIEALGKKQPALVARLRVFEGNREQGLEHLKRAKIAGQPRGEVLHLLALAFDLGEYEEFATKVAKALPGTHLSIVEEFNMMPQLPASPNTANDSDDPF